MKHFLLFLASVFIGLFLVLFIRQSRDPNHDSRAVLRVYAPNSFIKQWGPGPWLKEKFESTCDCRVEYHDAADSLTLIQRVKSEPKSRAADLVFGLDQYDLELAQHGIEWKTIKVDSSMFVDAVRPLLSRSNFIPYDWGILSFIGRKNDLKKVPQNIDDLLSSEFLNNISLQDPRMSTPGLQFILWLIQAKGEEAAFKFLQKFSTQVKTWGATWSISYGLFQKNQVKLTFSYVTSPIANLKESPMSNVVALPFSEGHPIQYEFIGIPSSCQNCDLAEKFVGLALSKEGQKIIMDKNYMFPVVKNVREGTLFEAIPEFKTIDMTIIPNRAERERILRKWSIMRRAE